MTARRHAPLAALMIAALAVMGCGADTEGPAAPQPISRPGTPVTDAQLLVLARVLEVNRERGGARFAARLPVHAMIGFLNLLAAETVDNTANLRDQDARLLGHATIGADAVDEYAFGRTQSTHLWIGRADRLLRRVRTDRVPGGLTVDLLAHGPIRIRLPKVR